MRCRIREVGSLCLAPVVLMGYLHASDFHFTKSHKTTATDGGVFSVQTCEKGLGLGAKISTNGYYGADLQYGVQFEPAQDYSLTFIPKLGLSYVDHPVAELPQRTQFGLGGQILGGYKQFRVGLELWHMSNGKALGLNVDDGRNIGVNMVLIQTGWVF